MSLNEARQSCRKNTTSAKKPLFQHDFPGGRSHILVRLRKLQSLKSCTLVTESPSGWVSSPRVFQAHDTASRHQPLLASLARLGLRVSSRAQCGVTDVLGSALEVRCEPGQASFPLRDSVSPYVPQQAISRSHPLAQPLIYKGFGLYFLTESDLGRTEIHKWRK